MYQFVTLDNQTSLPFQGLTYPWMQTSLQNLAPKGNFLAIGIYLNTKPVGLILAKYLSTSNIDHVEIVSIFIVPEHRQKGLGKELLTKIEEKLAQSNCQHIDILYSLNLYTPILEKILGKLNWSSGVLHAFQYSTIPEKIKNLPFLHRYSLNNSFTLLPWVDLTAQTKELIKSQKDDILKYPDVLSPFKEEETIEPCSSLVLYYHDEVVGWMIVNRICADTTIYSSLFVKPELQKLGRAIPLLAASINRQLQESEIKQAIFLVLADNTPMIKFVKRHLAPYLTSIRQYWKSSKILSNQAIMENKSQVIVSV
ncbi:GNAT family N-acetyltransferase [Calothrix sp. UHCC 0171]|uniref:GNAT family N-acetyltransferase n=1 Tax=Calothrix sp. UHCC 0171 TaxID=3110245 RepID=UPI002B21DE28|nr:GNAT family N-acetyltransferase [Calothrix sp. UHCC 0171]MEA5574318.1 GNAT family N-acetyltransferase [Calothrix sp. UHCC 0171]